jgi:outer membrane lipoprotein-sorting protein
MIKFYRFLLLTIIVCGSSLLAAAQDINSLIEKARQKIDKVTDYEAAAKMKTNVTFLKVPIATVKVYFKKPNLLKVKSEKGISFIPKGAVSINMNSILGSNDYTVIDAGKDKVGNTAVRVARLLPNDDNSDVVLSTVYIDEITNLILKAKTTTRENGTYELEMSYGRYATYGLPDKIIFSFNTKDYKLPKGVTFDFDDGTTKTPADKAKAKKGRAEIVFSSYTINKGLPASVFL